MKYNSKIVCAYFRDCRVPPCCTEYRFASTRQFRFDFAWPQHKVALEVEGGIFIRGAHGSISGIKRDMEKYNLAASMGWRILRVIPQEVCMKETVDLLLDTLNAGTGKAHAASDDQGLDQA